MKALFVSNDPKIFEEQSDVRARLRAYASVIGELHVVAVGIKLHSIQEGGLTLHSVLSTQWHRPFALAHTARRIIKKHAIEVVSAQDPFEQGWAAWKAVKGTTAKLHIQVHTDFLSPWFVRSGNARAPKMRVPFMNHVRRHLADQVLPHADGIRVVSERIHRSLIERYGNRIPTPVVIPIAASISLPPPVPLPPHEFSFAFITAGRLEPEKRTEDILYALARMGYQYGTVGLFIVGEGSCRASLEALTRKLGLSERVCFINWHEEGVLGLMQSAQAYIQASAYEGYGRTLIEAALAGLPIITTDVGIVGDVLQGYDDVLAAPVADPAALATHMRGVVEDHQARASLGLNAKHKVEAYLAGLPDLPTALKDDLAHTLIKR